MFADEEALLRTVCAAPDDDFPRLVYADFLEQSADPVAARRADFIRVQCELARIGGQHWKSAELKQAEQTLLKVHRRAWNGVVHRRLADTPLRGQVASRRGLVRGWDYRRGFIAELTVDAQAVYEHADLLASLGPVERLKVLHLPGGGLAALLQAPLLAAVRELDLASNFLADADVMTLGQTTRLRNLRWLRLREGLSWLRSGPLNVLRLPPAFGSRPAQQTAVADAVRQGRIPEPTF